MRNSLPGAKPESPPNPLDRLGRILGIDLGTKRVGVALTDELQITVRPLPVLARTSWKKLVRELREICQQFDVKMVVVGLPLRLDGTEGDASLAARRTAQKLHQTLALPVFLQDERSTSVDAENRLRDAGLRRADAAKAVDSEAAALILNDFIALDASDRQVADIE